MITKLRDKFNSEFTEENYKSFLDDINSALKYPADFRIAETPVFLTESLTVDLINSSHEIVNQIMTPDFLKISQAAIPPGLSVPNEGDHPTFLQIDFAVCLDDDGKFVPKLIELQGFPSLYGFQYFLDKLTRKHSKIPKNYTTYFNGIDRESYVTILKDTIVQNCDPENVVLLDIEPEKQKTRIDFAATEKLLGIKAVCISKIIQKKEKLFYKSGKREIPIKRIYNRVILDEMKRNKTGFNFNYQADLDVQWVSHPNWFFRISKHSLPFLAGNFVPETYFLNELDKYPVDLENFVLKPLYSFAGHGVEVDVTPDLLDQIKDTSNYILQTKVNYAPLIKTPDGFSKAEIRMMFVWQDIPILVNNLVRLSKGKMMGVDHNKEKTWVGSSLAYHPIVY
ncbi:MAG: hypothetical protein ACYCVH_09560 [Ignavibacteriaceae bacterium]